LAVYSFREARRARATAGADGEGESEVMIMNLRANPDVKARRAAARPAAPDAAEAAEDDEDEAGEPEHALPSGRRNGPAPSFEDGPVDSDDPNFSAWCAETGAEDRLDELGL